MNSSTQGRPDAAAPSPQTHSELHVPYIAPLSPKPVPQHPQQPTISSLPPIATAPPLGAFNGSAVPTGSNIPIVNGVRQVPASMPYVASTSSAPVATSMLPGMALPMGADHPHHMVPLFEHMDKCRYFGGLLLCYYFCTFFFLQPFFLGTLGVLTGFLGYYGSRPPIFAAHVKWIRGYVWMNYVMIMMNVWYLSIMVFYLGNKNMLTRAEDEGYMVYNEDHLGLFIGAVVAVNLLTHFKGLRTGQQFYAELLRAGPLPGQRTVIVLGGSQIV